jgi:hypothetical protein
VLYGEASEMKIEEELKILINNQWDWQVKLVDVKEYVAVFPDNKSLDTFSKICEIMMGIHGIKVKFIKSNLDPDACEIPQSTWIRIYGMPS